MGETNSVRSSGQRGGDLLQSLQTGLGGGDVEETQDPGPLGTGEDVFPLHGNHLRRPVRQTLLPRVIGYREETHSVAAGLVQGSPPPCPAKKASSQAEKALRTW